jgi:ribosomal-protein-alanine N-acetyltransferase
LTSDSDERARLSQAVVGNMTESDLDEVLAIERQSFPSAWSRASYERELTNRSSYYFTARLGGSLVGYVGMWIVMDEAHITTLAVHPAYRRRGLGGRLLAHLIELARRHGASRVTLEVRERNHAAIAMYRKFGFTRKGLLPGYYGDTRENGLVMWKLLSSQGQAGRTH